MKRIYTNLTLALAGAAMISTMTAKAENWKSIGTCEFRENACHVWWEYSYYPEINVEIEEDQDAPGRYRLVNPYREYPGEIIGSVGMVDDKDYYIIINACDPNRVYMEKSLTGFIVGGNAEKGVNVALWLCSQGYDFLDRYGSLDKAEAEGLLGKLSNGYINFPSGALLATYIDEDKLDVDIPDFSGDYAWWIIRDDHFRVHLPNAPYTQDSTIEFVGIDDALTTLTYNVTFDKDIDEARVAILPGHFDESVGQKLIDGSVDYTLIKKSGDVTFPYPGDGIYTVYAETYHKGQPQFTIYTTKQLDYSEDEWRKLKGTAIYTDAIMGSNELNAWGFTYDPCTYEVKVEQNVAKPYLFRIKDPYGEGYPYYDASKYDHSENRYLVIDATDGNRVNIKHMENVGWDMGGGLMQIWGRADRYFAIGLYTVEELETMDLYGHYENGVITFPENSILIHFGNHPSPDAWYWANMNGNFRLDLTGLTGVEEIAADANVTNEETEYYTLDGLKANAANLAPGIYVVRKGGKTYKEVVK